MCALPTELQSSLLHFSAVWLQENGGLHRGLHLPFSRRRDSSAQSHPLAVLEFFQHIKHRFPASEVFDALLNAVALGEV